jgi:ferric-dicitrate binding protein FerR (iron transport regulator)
MAEQNHIPNPQDLRLAQLLDTETPTVVSDDPLLPFLKSYKKSIVPNVAAEVKSDIWKSIDSKISAPRAKIHKLPARWLHVAAIVIFAVLIGLFVRFYSQPTHQLLASSDNSIVTYTLSDGSVATLRPRSELYVTEYSEQVNRYRITGEVHFDVVSNPDRIFTVNAGIGSVEVLGTIFTVSVHDNEPRVYLDKGSVRFSIDDDSESVILKPGEFSEIKYGRISEPLSAESQRFTSWIINLIVLDNRTIEDLLREIEFHFNVTTQIPESYSQEKLGGQLLLDDVNTVLEYIGLSLNGFFIETKPGEFIFTADP